MFVERTRYQHIPARCTPVNLICHRRWILISRKLLAKQTEKGRLKLRDDGMNQIALLTLRLGLNITQTSAQGMRQFVMEMLILGAKLGQRALQLNLKDVLCTLSPHKIRECISSAGIELKTKDMSEAKQVTFANIACDSGTVLGKTVIHALLTNPYHDFFPYGAATL